MNISVIIPIYNVEKFVERCILLLLIRPIQKKLNVSLSMIVLLIAV